MKKLNYRRIFSFAGLSSLLLVYILLWLNMITDPVQRSGSDFIGFYTYGRISQTRGFNYIHDLDEQQKLQSEVMGYEVAPIYYTHLPFISSLAALLVDEDYVDSFERWAVVLLLLNALNVHLLIGSLEKKRFEHELLAVLSVGAFLFFPTFSGFMNGQDTAILLTGAALWGTGIWSGKYFLAGLGLSLAAVRPQIALILAVPFLFRHRKVLWGFILGGSILAGFSLWLIGTEGAIQFMESVRYIENSVWHEPHSLDMPTLSGIIRRNLVLEDPAPARIFVWVCYALGIAVFSWLWQRSEVIDEKHLGLVSIAAVFLAPYAHYHDLILLLIPLFCLIRIFAKHGAVDPYMLAISPLVVSLMTMLGFAGSGVMKFPLVYAVMIVLAGLLIASDRFVSRGGERTSRI